MIVKRPVLEVCASEGFALWPVAFPEPYGLLPLSGALDPVEVGTAVMRVAEYNGIDPEDDGGPAQPTDPLGAFLDGLLTTDQPLAPGGMQVTDTTTGTTLLPGCCSGLDEWRDWFKIIDG
jgi:hypothetical protein